jgi:CheY-like chemotaxis protein/HPt (histidine-containing phosphotransfer) domain-containing protein
VTDTGIGIPEDIQMNLFQSFTQADGSTTRKYGGTGLGLAISKQLVELMGGRIGLESSAGHGSAFWFSVPLREGPQRRTSRQAATERKEGVHGGKPLSAKTSMERPGELADLSNRALRVLVAEDNLINQEVCSGMLTKLKVQATVVSDGLQVLRENERNPFDIIFMDCQMPGMDGYEATRQIRRSKGPGSQTIIIAMTADALQGSREKCLQAGMDDYIAKPFKQTELHEALTKWANVLRGLQENPPSDATNSQTPTAESEQLIDIERIEEINRINSQSRASLLGRVVKHFRDDSPLKIAAIREGVKHRDATAVRRVAHALRGGSAQVGAVVVAKLCEHIELLANDESLDGADQFIDALELSLTKAVAQLQTLVPKEELL